MKRLVGLGVIACAMAAASAMPTKKELAEAQKVVTEITAQDMRDLKAKKKTPAEVAKNHMDLAQKSNSEAGKFLLLQGAFKLYAKAGDYDGAATALETMNNEIKDMDPAVIVDIYNKAIFRSIKDKSPKLFVIKEVARKTANNRKNLPALEKAVKAKPQDAAAQKAYAECLAELGEWDKAIDAFILSGGKIAEMAKAEKDATMKPQELAIFWWDYGRDDTNAYRIHAAELYEFALEDEEFAGLSRELAEQRIDGLEKDALASLEWKTLSKKKAEQIAFDQPVTIKLSDTVSMEFKPVAAETFKMLNIDKWQGGPGGRHTVTISRPYWMGTVRVSCEMYRAFQPDHAKDDPKAKPTDCVASYDRAVDFSAWLTQRYRLKLPRGYVFRLPTEAEWELAERHKVFCDPVGAWKPKNTCENLLDCTKRNNESDRWKNGTRANVKHLVYADNDVDPVRQEGDGTLHRFGHLRHIKNKSNGCSFRLVIGPNLIAEKKRAAAQKPAAK